MSERNERNVTTPEKMKQNFERYKQRAAEIRADQMLSDEAKHLELGELYSKARSTYDQLTDKYRSGIRERLQETRKTAFAVPKIAGADKAMELLAYRSALDSVAKTKDTRELSELLARAEITGDKPLARAVLYRSCPRGSSSRRRRRPTIPWRLWAYRRPPACQSRNGHWSCGARGSRVANPGEGAVADA